MIKVIAYGRCSSEDGETTPELAYAAQLLHRALPRPPLRWRLRAESLAELAAAAAQTAALYGLTEEDALLLLAHDQLLPAPGSLIALEAAVAAGARSAWACDPRQPPSGILPEYYTLRGLERFASRLAALPAEPVIEGTPLPLMLLTTVAALRDGSWRSRAVRVPAAWVHDFSNYHDGRREDILPLVPATARRILDVGGGAGGFLAALKALRPCETHLCEVSAAACKRAAPRVDRVWEGDFLSSAIEGPFDCICFLDVLEHTDTPEKLLEKAKTLLAPGGVIVASLPNVGHWSVVADLLEGRWDYAPAGIHCITHLRFFSRHGIERLFAESGLNIVAWSSSQAPAPPGLLPALETGTLHVDWDSLATVAYHVVARLQQ